MWMAYVDNVEVVDLKSGLQSLNQQFERLAFDAFHEANYGMGRYLSPEECEVLGNKYENAQTICTQCLDGDITIEGFIKKMLEMDFGRFLIEIVKYLHKDLIKLYNLDVL